MATRCRLAPCQVFAAHPINCGVPFRAHYAGHRRSLTGGRPRALSAPILQPGSSSGPRAILPSRPGPVEGPPPTPGFDSIPDALRAIAAGQLVVVLDDEHRENEGDLIGAADRVSTERVAFLVRHTSGVVCVGMRGADLDRLDLPLMVDSAENEDTMYTAFTLSVDARDGITTGISAEERARTLRRLTDPRTRPRDLRRPGHVFPLRARPGGVLTRGGHTEAGADLTELAGCFPGGVLAEIVNDDVRGTMARTPQLKAFAAKHRLRIVTIEDLIRYRCHTEWLVEPVDDAAPAPSPPVTLRFSSRIDGARVSLVQGNLRAGATPRLELVFGQTDVEPSAGAGTIVVVLESAAADDQGLGYVNATLVAQTLLLAQIRRVATDSAELADVLTAFGIQAATSKRR